MFHPKNLQIFFKSKPHSWGLTAISGTMIAWSMTNLMLWRYSSDGQPLGV
ncbi:MAG TPA: hypothetical protein V6D43_17160 [Candidatus Sericytochromatia bacterium]